MGSVVICEGAWLLDGAWLCGRGVAIGGGVVIWKGRGYRIRRGCIEWAWL